MSETKDTFSWAEFVTQAGFGSAGQHLRFDGKDMTIIIPEKVEMFGSDVFAATSQETRLKRILRWIGWQGLRRRAYPP